MTRAVILAGGKGSRLGPYTTVLPKPLLPIGDRAILDVVVRQLSSHGIDDLTFAVGHLAHLIEAVFGDGSQFGVSIAYHHEDEPLGTAGALASVEGLDETFLFMNGDVLTTLPYDELLRAHKESGNILTIAAHRRTVQIDYGVLGLNGAAGATREVVGYDEKPEIPYTVSMGVYVAEPEMLRHIPPREYLDMPTVVMRMIEAGEQVGAFEYEGFWLDIGRHDDYERAIGQYDSLKATLLGEESSEAQPSSV